MSRPQYVQQNYIFQLRVGELENWRSKANELSQENARLRAKLNASKKRTGYWRRKAHAIEDENRRLRSKIEILKGATNARV